MLRGQRILIPAIVERIRKPLPPDANEIQVHQYACCYILALLGDMVFLDKSGDRVHLMWLEFMQNLRNPRKYSWGSATLSWLYRQPCNATDKKAKQIGGPLILVQLWIYVRFSHMSGLWSTTTTDSSYYEVSIYCIISVLSCIMPHFYM